jgi:hypothetical protein
MLKIKKLKNYIVLPGLHSPERLLAEFLDSQRDDAQLWKNIDPHFTKQFCFRDFTLSDIQSDRVKAKSWYNVHIGIWKANATKIINPWISANQKLVDQFRLNHS